MSKKILLVILTIFICITTTGCKDVQIFEHKAKDGVIAVSDRNMEKDKYYIKNATKFYPVYLPNGSAKFFSSAVEGSRTFCMGEDISKVPTHYKGELIAYSSDNTDFSEVTLERFKDMGYSIGAVGGYFDISDGYYHMNTKNNENLVENTNLANLLSQLESTDIRIYKINGKAITSDDVDSDSGTILGLEQNQSYKISFFAGTYYYEENVIADAKIIKSFEMFNYSKSDIIDTTNGYMCFKTPEDLKSGYYNINGEGIFKYLDHERGVGSDNVNMNENYYATEKEAREAYSREYSIDISNKTKDVFIQAVYSDYQQEKDAAKINGFVYSPDGTEYEMDIDEEKGILSLSLAEAIAGKWIVSIVPKTLEVEVSVDSSALAQQLTEEDTTFDIPEERNNVVFKADYEKCIEDDSEIYGIIVAPDGTTYDMENIIEDDPDNTGNKLYRLEYKMPYIGTGQYQVKIYHNIDETTVSSPELKDNTETQTDIIIVE